MSPGTSALLKLEDILDFVKEVKGCFCGDVWLEYGVGVVLEGVGGKKDCRWTDNNDDMRGGVEQVQRRQSEVRELHFDDISMPIAGRLRLLN